MATNLHVPAPVELRRLNFAFAKVTISGQLINRLQHDPVTGEAIQDDDRVLRDVSLTLQPGQRVLVVGGNGAGKSTLLGILAGKHLTADDTALIFGRDSFRDTTLNALRTFVSADWGQRSVAFATHAMAYSADMAVEEMMTKLQSEHPERRQKLLKVLRPDVQGVEHWLREELAEDDRVESEAVSASGEFDLGNAQNRAGGYADGRLGGVDVTTSTMNADDVEMEFISVMGVLVPMEVTKGVSNEAKRFVAGDVWSGEENTNQGEASNDVEHTEIKCNLSKKVKTTNCPITAKAEDSDYPQNLNLGREINWDTIKVRSFTVCGDPDTDGCRKVEQQKRTKMKKNIEAAAKAVPDGTSAAQIDDYSMESTNARAHSLYLLGTPFDTTVQISPAKSRKDKRSRPTDETRPPQRSNARRLDPESPKHGNWTAMMKAGNSEMQNSKSIKSLPLTSEDRVSNDRSDQDCCVYPECPQPALSKSRCAKHNGRPRCSLPDCTKFAHSGGNCIAHGGGSRCTEEGCGRRARSQGKCYTHGGGILCSHPNCTTRAKTKGKCVAHGGGTVCSEKECDKLVTANGKCISHGGWVNCSQPGCEKRVQLRGKCMEHSECDFPESDQPTKRFRKTTIKSDGMSILPAKRHRILSVGKSTAVETVDKPAKRAKEAKKAATTTELDETTMALRSGQRIKLVTRSSTSGYGEFQSAEDALQMALKLSEIEY
ncbi:P-loop containing nucleoside triphosphate hydrolase [Phytophthora cactorum]|nr:P-loop containing nucleoside triphosphate hydrolase [Phytophthora cactorum]